MSQHLSGNGNHVTIDQVAKQAKVSKTTVSRYLNGRFDMIGTETQERIRQVIAELDYHPSPMAQGLRAKHGHIIGCVVDDLADPCSASMVQSISHVCVSRGYQMMLIDSDNDARQEREAVERLLESCVDGLLVKTAGDNDSFLFQLAEDGVKLVILDSPAASLKEMDEGADSSSERDATLRRWRKIGERGAYRIITQIEENDPKYRNSVHSS